jgi:hypothetical protein
VSIISQAKSLGDVFIQLVIIDYQREDFVRGIRLVVIYLAPVSGDEELVDVVVTVDLVQW